MDFIDEKDIAFLKIGEECRKIAGLGDDGARGGTEVDAHLARHDLGQRGLAETRRPREQHVIQRLAPCLGGGDEDLEVVLLLRLADELIKPLRSQMRVECIFRRFLAAREFHIHQVAFQNPLHMSQHSMAGAR